MVFVVAVVIPLALVMVVGVVLVVGIREVSILPVVSSSIVPSSHVSHCRSNEHNRQMWDTHAKHFFGTLVFAHTCNMI